MRHMTSHNLKEVSSPAWPNFAVSPEILSKWGCHVSESLNRRLKFVDPYVCDSKRPFLAGTFWMNRPRGDVGKSTWLALVTMALRGNSWDRQRHNSIYMLLFLYYIVLCAII